MRESGNVAEVLSHFFVNAIGLPYFPTDFEVWEERRVMKREKIVALGVLTLEAVIRIVDPNLSVFVDLRGLFIGRS